MKSQKGVGKLLIHAIILLVLFFSLVHIATHGTKWFVILESLGLLLLLVLTFVAFIGYRNCWGKKILFFVYLLYLANLVLLWIYQGELYFILVLITILGFVVSIPSREVKYEVPTYAQEPISEVFEAPAKKDEGYVVVEPVEEKKTAKAKPAKEKKVSAKHSPGKYVASKRSNIYHEPKCDWAKKIGETRRLWFGKKEDAWEKGYRAHSCVK